MPELGDSYNTRRDSHDAPKILRNAAPDLDFPFRKAGVRERQGEEIDLLDEAVSLALEMIDRGLLEEAQNGTYQISSALCRKIITNMASMKMDVRRAIIDAVWSCYERDRTAKVLATVSDCSLVVYLMIRLD